MALSFQGLSAPTASQLEDIVRSLLPATGITLAPGSVTYFGGNGQGATFAGGQSILGFDTGLLLTSGFGTPPGAAAGSAWSNSLSRPGDSDLTAALGVETNDANTIAFTIDVTDAFITRLTFSFVFATEEYPTYTYDGMAIFVNGQNHALYPDALPVTSSNHTEVIRYNSNGPLPLPYNGISYTLNLVVDVTPGLNTIKLVVGDTNDRILDSAFFIGSIAATPGDVVADGFVNTLPQITLPATPVSMTEHETVIVPFDPVIADPDGDLQTVTLEATNGTVTLSTTAGLTFSAGDGDDDGTMSFSGTVAAVNTALSGMAFTATGSGAGGISVATSDGGGGIDSGNISIAIADVDPVISDDTVNLPENSAAGTLVTTVVATQDTDGLTYAITGGNIGGAFAIDAATGAITVADPSALDFEGASPSFSLTIAVDDEDADSDEDDTAIISIDLTDVNDAPVAADDTAAGSEDSVISGSVATNDSDQDGDPLNFALNGAAPAGLTFNGDGSWSLEASDVAYQALGIGDSTDVVAAYTVSDGNGGSDTATLIVTVNGINDAPVAGDDTAAGSEDTLITGSVATNDSDPENDPLSFALNGAAPAGLTFNGDGSWSLDASDAAYQALGVGESSDVVVSYTVSDGNGGSDTATLTVTVNGVNDTTVSSDDSYSVAEDIPLTIAGPGVLGNDTDADSDPLSAVLVSGPAHGSLVLNGDGSFTYTPDADFNGADSFTYKANDGTVDGNVATVSLAVGAVNDAPVGSPTAMLADGFEDQPYVVSAADLLAGFSDPEGDPLSVQNLAVVGGGSVADNGDGTYTITLPPDRAGSVTLTYQVSDGQGGLTPAVQGYEVIGDGDEAVFSGDTTGAVVEAGLAGPGIPMATGTLGVSDVDGPDTLVPILAGSRSIWGYGSVEMTKDGVWTYTLDNSHPKVDALKARETLSDRFVAVAADGTQQVVLITISGADDGVRSVPGTSGDDTLASTSADENILGGRGLDTAVFTGALAGYELTRLGDGSVKIVDIDPSDGDDGTDTLSSIELLRFGTAEPVTIGSLVGRPDWTLDKADVALTAAAYQFFTGALPSAAGFEYLILSSANPNDLNDPYYAGFNLENLYLNFASNLGTAGAGASFFDAEYGSLSFEATVKAAYLDIVGTELTGAALDFFLDAEDFYQSVAASRVVRPGVDLAEATKIVAIGSILHEAVKADSGVLGQAVNDFAAIVNAAGTAEDFGHSLFATV